MTILLTGWWGVNGHPLVAEAPTELAADKWLRKVRRTLGPVVLTSRRVTTAHDVLVGTYGFTPAVASERAELDMPAASLSAMLDCVADADIHSHVHIVVSAQRACLTFSRMDGGDRVGRWWYGGAGAYRKVLAAILADYGVGALITLGFTED
jgi:hypothetical protein